MKRQEKMAWRGQRHKEIVLGRADPTKVSGRHPYTYRFSLSLSVCLNF